MTFVIRIMSSGLIEQLALVDTIAKSSSGHKLSNNFAYMLVISSNN